MARVHHRGHKHLTAKQRRARRKRPCRSAPAAPTNVSIRYAKQNEHRRQVWRAIARLDAVTLDVAGRDLEPEFYDVEIRATDASGDPVETQGQAESTTAYGEAFSVESGSAAVGTGDQVKARELNASPDVVKKTLTSLTTGIEVSIDFWARKDVGGSSPTIRCSVYNVTDSVEVVGKNATPDSTNLPKLVATRSFTPVAGKTYEARVAWVSGSGIALFHQAQWRDQGDTAVWRKRIAGDVDPLRAVFRDIPKPRAWYFAARARALNRVAGARCFSAWSDWTTPTNPVTGDPIGPPAPDGLSLVFHRDEARKRSPFSAKTLWNETPWWIPPDGDPVEGADRYAVQFAVSNDGGTSTVRTRRVSVQAKDEDADQTAFYEFHNIRRRRHYRFRVRAFRDDRRGAWSDWSAWRSPATDIGAGPNAPQNVTTTKPRPGHLLTTWDEPTNPEDVDRYRVRVYNLGVLRETTYTRSHRHRYVIPDADRGTAHSVRVTSVDEDDNLSSEQQHDATDDPGPEELPDPPGTPSNPALSFDVAGTKHAKYRAVVQSGTSSTGGEVAHYILQLAHGVATSQTNPPSGIRRVNARVEGDAVGSDELTHVFKGIPKTHRVWVRGRASNAGGKSSWTGWQGNTTPSGSSTPSTPSAPTVTSPVRRRFVGTWPDPDDENVVSWLVTVRQGSTTKESDVVVTTPRYVYRVPKADRGLSHNMAIKAVNSLGNTSSLSSFSGGTSDTTETVSEGVSDDLGNIEAGVLTGVFIFAQKFSSDYDGAQSNYVEIDGQAGEGPDCVLFVTSAADSAITAGGGGLQIGRSGTDQVSFWGTGPVTRGSAIANLTIAGSPASNNALEDTSAVAATVHRNFGDLTDKVNQIVDELQRIGLFV